MAAAAPKLSPKPESALSLADLKPNDRAVVRQIVGNGPVQQRLMQLGLLEGTDVKVVRFAPAGDPMEIEVFGYALSLRKAEAATVLVARHG